MEREGREREKIEKKKKKQKQKKKKKKKKKKENITHNLDSKKIVSTDNYYSNTESPNS